MDGGPVPCARGNDGGFAHAHRYHSALFVVVEVQLDVAGQQVDQLVAGGWRSQ